ncbi:tryptophan halogenase [Pelomonas sp. Root1217]|uniref:tryptophan halogenase family protein n=1 Tax=Pelomonas sp. Root1217 TaxID=1736430 RepID=UPI00070DBAC3|nr:tryptophan halogenase family protein [Pelomonas sp. Root1217]KQV46794.1 tryptophan halogenase [Pelomonas sp. Root1217]
MRNRPLQRIVIVGGGSAGWITAAPLARMLCRPDQPDQHCEVTLVESADIGTVGVGEATLPTIQFYNQLLGIDEADFVRRTRATFKLGIEFQDWGRIGNRFFHGFGGFGPAIHNRPLWAYWLRLQALGDQLPSYEEWSTATVMARQMRFVPPTPGEPAPSNAFNYAFHFDASLYGAYLREYALKHGAQRTEGTITRVETRPEDGFVTALHLSDGRRVEGDLFIDCSGFRALLIDGAMKSPYEDWSHWLPCDRALAVPCESAGPMTPYTRSTARTAGWQWRIPLQHRTGNGLVYCSGYLSDDEAQRTLLDNLDGKALDEPRQQRFVTGRRKQGWVKNVVAVGLSSGFLEPLESTSLHLIMDAVSRLTAMLPDQSFQPALADEFNRQMAYRYESVRDFIILHYKLGERRDSEFWRYCADMPIPDDLAHQIALFRKTGRVAVIEPEGFAEPSWASILLGLGVYPERYDPYIDLVDPQLIRRHLHSVHSSISRTVASMPSHADFLNRISAPPKA